ncbi:YfiT family bacillithiol transferase [Acidicapsa acidisoli]|uniref:YfiT family bacillithiol transferase n=1 Tax=Acidicapsa acidisoli TaxID=1615681 RepID=UPI0021E0DCA4|nr:bacillithiol transferase BstA [Acidicapsa acidisoli]
MTVHSETAHSAIDILRFPIGRFRLPASITAVEHDEYIETLRLLPERLKAAAASLNDSQLDTPYRDGGWSLRQVVHHVADSHANSYVRFKLALTEDWPTIKPYDEAAWAELSDSRLSIDVSLTLIAALHARWVALVESLPDADFARGYVHPAGGRQNLAQVLALYAWHSRHHTAHIANLRERMGW